MKLRDYQIEAVESVRNAAKKGYKRILLNLATGSGKSACIAEMARLAPNKVLVLCHQAEILEQNQRAFKTIANEDSGIFCAGLGQKDLSHRVTFAHRDSIGQDGVIESLGEYPLVITDEAHLVGSRKYSRYQRILEAINYKHLVGLTATPFRLSGGRIFGRGKFFEYCAYNMTISKLVERGYLSPYRFENVPTFKTDGVDTKGQDFDLKQLNAKALQKIDLDNSAQTIMQRTTDRKCSLIFCVGREHAKEIQNRIPQCEYIDGETPQEERTALLNRMRNGEVKYCVNVGVLTTGVDIPLIDCVVMLRPTQSASLWIQCTGRGLRLHPDKKDLLILELTDNFERFGSLDDPMLFGSERESEITLPVGSEVIPQKLCPECDTPSPNGTRVCPFCGMLFLKRREEYGPNEILTLEVKSFSFAPVITRAGNNAILATFYTELGVVKEWLNLTNPNRFIAETAKAKLRKLKTNQIDTIKVKGIAEKFPRVMSYHAES